MAYLAGAWLVLQVADTVIPWLGLDDSVGRILLIVLIVGFIPAVIATWLFEWTPDGIRFDDEVEVDAAGAIVARRRLDRIIIGILAVAVVYFTVDEFVIEADQAGLYTDNPSVAVLPFEDNSPDGDQAYFANGIADELRLELQHLDGLRVAGQTSSNAYAQEDFESIGEILNVDTILEGGVRKDGDNVRITVRLTNAADGFTIWSDSYDREFNKLLQIQEDIATSVAGALGVRLGVGGVNAFHGAGTRNVDAYEAYLQAQSNDYSPSGQDNAIPLLKRALDLDPNYAVAWAMLASRVLTEAWHAPANEIPELLDRGHEHALRAVELNPESAAANSLLGIARMMLSDWIGSEQAHRRARELLTDRLVAGRYGVMLMRSGRLAEAQKQFRIAVAAEPMNGRPATLSWHASLAQSDISEAKERKYWNPGGDIFEDKLDIAFNEPEPEALKLAIQGLPENNVSNISLYRPLLSAFDSPAQVLSLLNEVYQDKSLQWPRKLHDIAMAAVYFGDSVFALKVKTEDIRANPSRIVAIWYPVMSEVRRLPEFKDFVSEINLVDYWRAYGWADACAPLGDNDFTCN